jgi:signal transduction histidine kinase
MLTVDVICHELRNPLNGIYHNADILTDSIKNIKDIVLKFRDELLHAHRASQLEQLALGTEDAHAIAHLIDFLDTELAQDLESLESLNLCAKHQKRIADDVLQMSKLSMNLVSLSKKPFDPLIETSNVIRMFEREAFVKDIMFKFTLGDGYRTLQVGWVLADAIRFSQVLLNFVSNAVRFTEKSARREIEVRLDASLTRPELSSTMTGSPDIIPAKELDEDVELPLVYLMASVADSGVGLTQEERSHLFQKFAQASPKTHIEYGGSGLGLFISKALVEVQGGRVSLDSEKYHGTTLSFYIEARRVDPPAPSDEVVSARSLSPRIMTPKLGRDSSPVSYVHQVKPYKVLIVEDNLVSHLIRKANVR